jgi:hypothetical protein
VREQTGGAVDPLERFGFVEVRGGGSRIVCLPAVAGRIVALELGGRQWLWHNPWIAFAAPEEGASYALAGDSGGLDECFPTVAACRLPGWVRGWGGLELPEHGELWSQAPEVDIDTGAEGQAVVTTWEGRRLPFRITRVARVVPDGSVVLEYHATNDSAHRIPFVWAPRPMLPLTPGTELLLPEGAPLRVVRSYGLAMGDARSLHRWPFVRAAGRVLNFLTPFSVAREYACQMYLDMPEGRAAVRQGSLELEVLFDARTVGQFALWLNKGGWSPFKGRARRRGYCNMVFAPAIGAPDSLAEALGDWRRAQWLEPGEVRSWWIAWRARAVAPEEGPGGTAPCPPSLQER